MRKRWRILRVLKWTGVLLCLFLLAGSTVSWYGGLAYFTASGQEIFFISGGLHIQRGPTPPVEDGFYVFTPRVRHRPLMDRLIRHFQAPEFNPRFTWVPFGLPLVFAACVTASLFWRDRMRLPANHCQNCAYDLRGNTSGRCPECGEAI
ncbi:MAG: hypothetical protein MI923_17095 [Phycisphaerales bacterium]|nr:hypothetical protein [Phycisphaerales bacterium]